MTEESGSTPAESIDLTAIWRRAERYQAALHPDVRPGRATAAAMASAADVPALLAEIDRLSAERDAFRLDLARLGAPRPDPYADCDGCSCCTAVGCHGGPGSDCPRSSRTDEVLCPCTGG